MVGQAGVGCGKAGRSTARASPISSFLREFFILLHGKGAKLPFGKQMERVPSRSLAGKSQV